MNAQYGKIRLILIKMMQIPASKIEIFICTMLLQIIKLYEDTYSYFVFIEQMQGDSSQIIFNQIISIKKNLYAILIEFARE